MGFFLARSFGVLALLAAAFAGLSCRGPWLQEFPAWFILVPISVSVVLAILGIVLLRLPVNRTPSLFGYLFGLGFIILAAWGGSILTQYFHGESVADQQAMNNLAAVPHQLGPRFIVGASILIVAAVILKFRNKN